MNLRLRAVPERDEADSEQDRRHQRRRERRPDRTTASPAARAHSRDRGSRQGPRSAVAASPDTQQAVEETSAYPVADLGQPSAGRGLQRQRGEWQERKQHEQPSRQRKGLRATLRARAVPDSCAADRGHPWDVYRRACARGPPSPRRPRRAAKPAGKLHRGRSRSRPGGRRRRRG